MIGNSPEARLLNLIQESVPFVKKPFDKLAQSAGITPEDAIEIVRSAKDNGLIRNISGIFNGESLGYSMSLVAFMVSEENLDKAASVINSYPGVSHNYLRGGEFNVWFTIAVPPGELLEEAIHVIFLKSGASKYLVLKNEKLLKVKAVFGFGDDRNEISSDHSIKRGVPKKFSEFDMQVISLLQKDLPVTGKPFEKLISDSGHTISEDDFLSSAENFVENGYIRRYSATVRHTKAGFSSNAMVVWKYAEKSGNLDFFMDEKNISHLYLRSVYPGIWEYNLFSMIHARSDEELSGIIKKLSGSSGLTEYMVLRSLREFKKKRVIYFSPEFKEWEKKYND